VPNRKNRIECSIFMYPMMMMVIVNDEDGRNGCIITALRGECGGVQNWTMMRSRSGE